MLNQIGFNRMKIRNVELGSLFSLRFQVVTNFFFHVLSLSVESRGDFNGSISRDIQNHFLVIIQQYKAVVPN